MASPFPPSAALPGKGHLVVGRGPDGRTTSALEAVSYQYPLKLIAPSADTRSHSRSVLVFLLSYGGGLVAGDRVHLTVDVRRGARLSIVTQGTTKVFKMAPASAAATTPAAATATRQTLLLRVAPGAGLCLLPDPVQPFADSVYEQLQVVRMEDDDDDDAQRQQGGGGGAAAAASLCLLDWVTHGRAARGENWSLARWKGRNEVWLAAAGTAQEPEGGDVLDRVAVDPHTDRLLVRDAVLLERSSSGGSDGGSDAGPASSLADSMHGLAVFGTLILRGPLVHALGRFFLAEFAALPRLGARGFDKPLPLRPAAPGAASDKAQTAAAAAATEAAAEAAAEAATAAWRAELRSLEHTHGVLWSAAAVRGCVVVKFGARSVEGGRLWIGSMLLHEGSVAAEFGEDALMCVK